MPLDSGKTRVSVVIPSYNAAATIGGAVSSALAQTYSELEVVVVDDGSTDDTSVIVEAYGDRVHLVQQPNAGPSAARNAGVQQATGDIIVLCDADDVIFPHHVGRLVTALWRSERQRRWVSADALMVRHGGFSARERVLPHRQVHDSDQPDRILQLNFVSIFAAFHRSMFDELGGFDVRLRRAEDWNFWARAILHGWRVDLVTEPGGLYRPTPTSLTGNSQAMIDAEQEMLVRLLEEEGELISHGQADLIRQREAAGSPDTLRRTGRERLRSGDLAAARLAYIQAARLLPADRRLQVQAVLLRLTPPWMQWRLRSAARSASGRRRSPR